jgi:hypothetical protein
VEDGILASGSEAVGESGILLVDANVLLLLPFGSPAFQFLLPLARIVCHDLLPWHGRNVLALYAPSYWPNSKDDEEHLTG